MNMRPVAAAVLSVALAGVMASPATAGSVSVTGEIELAASTESAARTSGLNYGSKVAFNTSVNGRMATKGYVYVRVLCWQESEIVYQASEVPDFEFLLADQIGQGLEWDGGDALCTSELVYRIDGKRPVIETLDQVEFAVSSQTA